MQAPKDFQEQFPHRNFQDWVQNIPSQKYPAILIKGSLLLWAPSCVCALTGILTADMCKANPINSSKLPPHSHCAVPAHTWCHCLSSQCCLLSQAPSPSWLWARGDEEQAECIVVIPQSTFWASSNLCWPLQPEMKPSPLKWFCS